MKTRAFSFAGCGRSRVYITAAKRALKNGANVVAAHNAGLSADDAAIDHIPRGGTFLRFARGLWSVCHDGRDICAPQKSPELAISMGLGFRIDGAKPALGLVWWPDAPDLSYANGEPCGFRDISRTPAKHLQSKVRSTTFN